MLFLSRKLSNGRGGTVQREKEYLDIKWVVDTLRYYPLGSSFTLFSDHTSLQRPHSMRDIKAWRWLQTGGGAAQTEEQTPLGEVSVMKKQDMYADGVWCCLSYSEVTSESCLSQSALWTIVYYKCDFHYMHETDLWYSAPTWTVNK